MSAPPRTWHKLPTLAALYRLAAACEAEVNDRPSLDAFVVETEVGTYWASRAEVTA